MLLDPRRIVIIWGESSSSSSRPSAFDLSPKAPAGQTTSSSSRPEFTIYLGVNTGPYNTTSNGTLILPPIPIEWIVSPRNVTSTNQCPTRGGNLLLFGITNFIVLGLIFLVGCRPLLRYLTGGWLGAPTKWSKYWTWILSFLFIVGSNALVSKLIVDTEGYQHLSMLNVFALYSSRPRINQVWTGLLRVWIGPVLLRGRGRVFQEKDRKKRKGRKETGRDGTRGGWWRSGWNSRNANEKGTRNRDGHVFGRGRRTDDELEQMASWRWVCVVAPPSKWKERWTERMAAKEEMRYIASRGTRYMDDDYDDAGNYHRNLIRTPVEHEWIYTDSYVATSIAECLIQLVSAIFIGITWSRFPNEPIREHMKGYYNYMLAAPALSLAGWAFIPIWWGRDRGFDEYSYGTSKTANFWICVFFLGLPGFFTYGVAWRYWAEFLLLPGSLWCPPRFVEQAAVWSSFSGLSSISGAVL